MFQWDTIQYNEEGKILLLYRHERIFIEDIIQPNMVILDVGGWGILASRILQEGSCCIILDTFSEDQYYPERVKRLPHIVGDILDVDLINSLCQFDVITCFEMLEHCEDIRSAFKNMYNLLKPSGVIAGTIPIPGFCHPLNEQGIKFLDQFQLMSFLEITGFKNIRVEPTASIYINDVPSSIYFKGTKI